MTINFVIGNLLTADVETLVNPVNCVGIMGKGLALLFKQAFPSNYLFYEEACRRKKVMLGSMLIYEMSLIHNPKLIINFPTKKHWKNESKIEDIKTGLSSLKREIETRNIKSLALPALGCGNGGLDWKVVCPLIENKLNSLKKTKILLFTPESC